jgi:hypothetical protein
VHASRPCLLSTRSSYTSVLCSIGWLI